MKNKSELMQMLWGLSSGDRAWQQKNAEMLKVRSPLLPETIDATARKIGMRFNLVQQELRTINKHGEFDIPAIVLGQELPEELVVGKLPMLIEECRTLTAMIPDQFNN
jgi:hypothetical protein